MFTPRNRISYFQAVALFSVSLVLDLLSFIPVVDWIMLALYWIIFPIWFKLLGIPVIKAKRMGSWLVTSIIEAIPFLSILPGFTLNTVLVIKSVWKEDKAFNASQMVTMKTQADQQAREEAALQYQRYMEQKMVESE